MHKHPRLFATRTITGIDMEIPFDQSLGAERGLCRWSDLKYMSSLSPNRQVVRSFPFGHWSDTVRRTEFKINFRRELEYYFRHAFIHLFCGFVATTFGLFVIFDKPISRNSVVKYKLYFLYLSQ